MKTCTGRSLRLRWLLIISLTAALCQGCGRQESPQSRTPSDDSNSKRRTQISNERGKQADWGLNTCVAAVKQPQFTPLIDREGAIITFDRSGTPFTDAPSVRMIRSRKARYQSDDLPEPNSTKQVPCFSSIFESPFRGGF